MSSEGIELGELAFDLSRVTDEGSVTTTPEPAVEDVSIDVTFEVLKNQRRRWVLRYLNEHEGPVSLSDLSEHVASLENDKPVGQLSSQERKRVYVGLYQCHLPKMADMGFILFNKSRGFVELGPAASYANEYLYDVEPAGGEWPRYYLGVVGFGWLLFGLSVIASDLLLPAAALLLFLLVVSTVALFHIREQRGDELEEGPVGSEAGADPA